MAERKKSNTPARLKPREVSAPKRRTSSPWNETDVDLGALVEQTDRSKTSGTAGKVRDDLRRVLGEDPRG